jgi:hypothetical protein
MRTSNLMQTNLRSIEVLEFYTLMYRLKRVEAELADCLARASVIESSDSDLAKLYTRVVSRSHAVEAAMYEQAAR